MKVINIRERFVIGSETEGWVLCLNIENISRTREPSETTEKVRLLKVRRQLPTIYR